MTVNEILLTILKLASVPLLVLLNGFFVAAEFALVKIRDTQLESLVSTGYRRARVARRIVHNLDAALSATQLGITLASLGLGWVGKPVFAALLAPLIRYFNIEPSQADWLAFAVGFTIITFLHIVVGELAPKSLAIQKPLPTSLWVAQPLQWFYKLFYPAIWLLNHAAFWLLRRCGLQPVSEAELVHSEEEIRLILGQSRRYAKGPSLGKDIALNAFALRQHRVREVMTPRHEIVALNTEDRIERRGAAAIVAQSQPHQRESFWRTYKTYGGRRPLTQPITMNTKTVQTKPFGTRTANEAKIVTATSSDEPRAVSTIVIAFAADPAARWLYPRAERYLEHFPQFVRAFGGKAFADGTADCLADFCGVALWLAPNAQSDEAAVVGVLEKSVYKGRLPEVFNLLEQMGHFHPSEPHWYLPLIGVDPGAQSRGLGSALLRRAVARCDREQVPAYLESTSPRNSSRYERFGFKAVGRIKTPSSPAIIPMVRPGVVEPIQLGRR